MDSNSSTSQNPKRLKEADALFKKGKSAVATGLLKWSADHLSGSLHFEQAAKLYKELGANDKAKEAYVKYAISSEAIDARGCAADGFTQAAFLEKDFKSQLNLLKKAEEQYLIDGQGDRALTNFKEFAKQQLDTYENMKDAGQEDPQALQNLAQLYKNLHKKVYDTDDNYVFNSDLIDHYMNMLVKYKMYHDAIEARKTFCKYLIKVGTVDHQIRRAYVEVVCLHILANEKFKVNTVLEEFANQVPGAMTKDEYKLGENIMFAIAQEGMSSILDEDWRNLQATLKKPLFNFLNNEIVRSMKILCLEKIEKQEAAIAGEADTQMNQVPGQTNVMDGDDFA